MNQAVLEMLAKYKVEKPKEAENALKEIVQEIALLGLYRAKFFEKAAFCGGTALRILYGLPRFSEDLDFTLFHPQADFSLTPYFSALRNELEAFGLSVEIESVSKKVKTEIESAFIKANTKVNFLKIQSFQGFENQYHSKAKLHIKFEVDTEPVEDFTIETRYLLAPTTFSVIVQQKPDLFAGKIHALLYRNWKYRVKGRDFYDYIWFLKNGIPMRVEYFQKKAIQSGHLKSSEKMNINRIRALIRERIGNVDLEKVKGDILPFIKDPAELNLWNKEFFLQVTEQLRGE